MKTLEIPPIYIFLYDDNFFHLDTYWIYPKMLKLLEMGYLPYISPKNTIPMLVVEKK